MKRLPDAEVVIIGGGAIGCGVAYALARAGKTDILVLERAPELGRGTTAQGAGLCGQVRSTAERVRLAMHSVATFRELQASAEVTPDWHEVGSLRVAWTERRAEELRQLRAVCAEAGLAVEWLEGDAARRYWPALDVREARAALWCPTDGWMTPHRVVAAYAHQCRAMGVRFETSVRVEAISCGQGRVTGVHTDQGVAACRYVINAAGAHAYHVARLVGLELPVVPVRHEYSVSTPLPGLSPDLPCLRLPELALYGRVRDGGLLLGGWESEARHVDPRTFDLGGGAPPLEPDEAVLGGFENAFARLFPALRHARRASVGKGWPTFTPDGHFILGESARVPGFVMAGGCNAHGISGSGGIGKLMVESLLAENPSDYVRALSPDRFAGASASWDTQCRAARSVYETYYGV